ncbi:MAG: hypothetical protein IE916_02870 [Epsilonproteobacteria bacterium]|nr:hypothetical protein [Campylobacterota bacterium]
MIYPVVVALNLILGVFFFSLTEWLEIEQVKLEKINQEHLYDIQKLEKIAHLNSWLKEAVDTTSALESNQSGNSDIEMVKYVDRYSKKFDFTVRKYLFSDGTTQQIELGFSIPIDQKERLKELMKLEYPGGFIHFSELKKNDLHLSGTLEIIKPKLEHENNVSEQ